jgi:hypothetical protein
VVGSANIACAAKVVWREAAYTALIAGEKYWESAEIRVKP